MGSIVENEFLIYLKSSDLAKQDKLFLELLHNEKFGATLINRKVFKAENKVTYRVSLSASSLIQFKKCFDAMVHYESLELFEYKEW